MGAQQEGRWARSQFHPQLLLVEIAFAFVRIAFGLISAGNNHGSSNHVLVEAHCVSGTALRMNAVAHHPKAIRNRNSPATAP